MTRSLLRLRSAACAGFILTACGLAACGCQSWTGGSGGPGSTSRHDEREITKLVKNDPFPSPEQVGLKSSGVEKK
ncbi:MAG: hypothetical protein AAGA92_14910 [Planctomycetota bacterium]